MTIDDATRVLAIVGPTGAGKSDVAMALAERLGGEIISCDSVQVYRHFDIGSAKPSLAERNRVAHHLVDVARWDEPYDAAQFCLQAETAIAEIHSRGRLSILCGGTGLYMRTLRYGLMAAPPADLQLRAQLQHDERSLPGSLHVRLAACDPASAERIHPSNLPHVMRALELCLQTQQPASQLRRDHGFKAERVPMMVICLDRETEILRARIARRTQAMLEAGWVAEVQHLLAQGVSPDCRPMRSVGYREIVAHLQGDASYVDVAAKITASTWQYARRQRTWWRRERDVHKCDMDPNGDEVPRLLALWQGAGNRA